MPCLMGPTEHRTSRGKLLVSTQKIKRGSRCQREGTLSRNRSQQEVSGFSVAQRGKQSGLPSKEKPRRGRPASDRALCAVRTHQRMKMHFRQLGTPKPRHTDDTTIELASDCTEPSSTGQQQLNRSPYSPTPCRDRQKRIHLAAIRACRTRYNVSRSARLRITTFPADQEPEGTPAPARVTYSTHRQANFVETRSDAGRKETATGTSGGTLAGCATAHRNRRSRAKAGRHPGSTTPGPGPSAATGVVNGTEGPGGPAERAPEPARRPAYRASAPRFSYPGVIHVR
jgi:hypothetical protein